MMNSKKVCAIIVTYSDRFHFLEQVVLKLLSQGIFKIIIVDNNASYESKAGLQSLVCKNNKVLVISLSTNTGSANGYSVGIKYALEQKGCDFFWFLDDDNEPRKGALSILIEQWERYKDSSELLALASFRESRKAYLKFLKGNKISRNGFLGINFLQKLFKVPISFFFKSHFRNIPLEVELPYSAYGGLFLSRDVLKRIGYPQTEYLLYIDDHEFTHRVVKMGGKIILLPDSKILDIDDSWDKSKTNTKSSTIHNFFTGSDRQVYYSVRNRVHFEYYNFMENRMIYFFNLIFFVIIIFSASIFFRNLKRFKLIKNAIIDGISERLGEKYKLVDA